MERGLQGESPRAVIQPRPRRSLLGMRNVAKIVQGESELSLGSHHDAESLSQDGVVLTLIVQSPFVALTS